MRQELLDVIVVGAGPAGLSAALILGRCLRRVLVVDTGRPRNYASRALHGFLTRDGLNPGELRAIAREQLQRYTTVRLEQAEATHAERREDRFVVAFADGRQLHCRKLLIATGVVDELPDIEGFHDIYGRSAHHCPYCDGWEWRDQPLAVLGTGRRGYGLSTEMKGWSRDIVLCTNGPAGLKRKELDALAREQIEVRQQRIVRLESRDGLLERLVFDGGSTLARRALFFSSGQRQGSALAAELGCTFNKKGAVMTGDYEITNVPGVYVAGDASRLMQMAIVAASEGAKAAFAINSALLKERVSPATHAPL